MKNPMQKITIFFTISLITTIVLTSTAFGMGYDTDEEADYVNGLWNSGLTPEDPEWDRLIDEYEREHHTGAYSPENMPSYNNTKSQKTQPATKQNDTSEAAKPTSAPVKEYSHDYSSITDEAKEAFIAFTADGQPNSCYLNIGANSKNNVITGKELNATRTGKENGRISFVDNGKIIYEWLFTNWESEDDAVLDLTVKFDKTDNNSYELAFLGSELYDNDVTFRLQTDMPSTELYIYNQNSTELTVEGVLTTDNEGFVVMNPKTLGKYILSTTDLLSQEEAKEPEPTEIPESVAKKDENTDKTEETTTANLIPEDVANNVLVLDDEPVMLDPKYIFIGLGVVVLIAAGIIIYQYRQK